MRKLLCGFPHFLLRRRRGQVACVVGALLGLVLLGRPGGKGELGEEGDDAAVRTFHERLRRQSGQVCVHPQLDPFHSSVAGFFHDVGPVECKTEENWVYVDNGTFRISRRSRRRHGRITCEYAPVIRGNGDFTSHLGTHIKPMLDGVPITSDFFKVACVSRSGSRYFNLHAGVAVNASLHRRHFSVPLAPDSLGLDVLMFGFDSVSKMTWLRKLPKTREYFVKELGGLELDGYNIVGDGTPQALLPILTGQTEEELPEARRGHKGAKPVDDHPWIWKEFQRLGYVTMWGEDMASIGTFQLRMLGFKHQPVDHFMRIFYLSAERMFAKNSPLCLGSLPRHKVFFNWFKDGLTMYANKRKFLFGFYGEISHNDNNMLQATDLDNVEFLQFLKNEGHLENSILILMSDHGARFSDIRATAQGKLEERMPYFAFRFPSWFESKYPEAMRNFRTNTQRLTTPFDIHATLEDIQHFSGGKMGNLSSRGISLFQEIPKERSCRHAGVEPHWCACLAWEAVDQEDPLVQQLARAAVGSINSWTQAARDRCAELSLSVVSRAVKYSTRSDVLKYKRSADKDGRLADLSGQTESKEDFFQITFFTKPNSGQYEITVRHSKELENVTVSEREVSRINRYGSDPECIMKDLPHLRPYCYCKS